MSLDRSSPKPLHLQLEEILRHKIENKELIPHQAIPSENELSRQFNLSRMTVRNVITRLVSDGMLYRVPGKGTFVTEPKITTAPITQMGIREQLEAMGYETDTAVVDKRVEKATKKIADFLNISEGDPIYILERLRYANNEPLSLHTSYIPAELCNRLFEKDIERIPLCNILDKDYKIVAKRGIETLESIGAGTRESKLLEVKKGFPLLLLRYVMYSQNEVPFEYAEVIFRGDRIKLKFEFHR
ncbi:GntR family transcriptional regulator [Petroclostridium xylanilyticum]|uniref:GntR family transcriptional regulator n=1 Tax=Petroclostridium xylanilyticum TaxID=1792311 RepID=UPI000B98F238|nr:GntR family transcriptional regulator [Petroclostridium xylanilyticum]